MGRTLPNECAPGACDFEFRTVWYRSQPASADASGGTNLTISGYGFFSGTRYQCAFADNLHSENVTAILVSSSELICTVPAWRHAASTVDVQLHQIDAQTQASSLVASDEAMTLQLMSGWTSYNQTIGAAKGGDMIGILGFGFDVNSAGYACTFKSKENILSVQATVVSDVSIICRAHWPYFAALTNFGLTNQGALVPYHTGQRRNATARFDYFEGWDRMRPTTLPASGAAQAATRASSTGGVGRAAHASHAMGLRTRARPSFGAFTARSSCSR